MCEVERLKVHLVGPDYSPEEAGEAAHIAALLERDGIEVYLRSRDGLESVLPRASHGSADERRDAAERSVVDAATFALEVYRTVTWCDCLVYNMNGRTPDDSGALLAAVAFASGKPVVLYKRDHRTKLFGNDNAMVSGLSYDFKPVTDLRQVGSEVRKAVGKSRDMGGEHVRPLPFVQANADLGQAVCEALTRFKSEPEAALQDFYLQLGTLLDSSTVAFRRRTPRRS